MLERYKLVINSVRYVDIVNRISSKQLIISKQKHYNTSFLCSAKEKNTDYN